MEMCSNLDDNIPKTQDLILIQASETTDHKIKKDVVSETQKMRMLRLSFILLIYLTCIIQWFTVDLWLLFMVKHCPQWTSLANYSIIVLIKASLHI